MYSRLISAGCTYLYNMSYISIYVRKCSDVSYYFLFIYLNYYVTAYACMWWLACIHHMNTYIYICMDEILFAENTYFAVLFVYYYKASDACFRCGSY